MEPAEEAAQLARIRVAHDFPIPGVAFIDLNSVGADALLWRRIIDRTVAQLRPLAFTKLAAVEARGFLLAATVAYVLGKPWMLIRKPDKLPGQTFEAAADMEYASTKLQCAAASLTPADSVMVFDDVIATGGTLLAACALIERAGARVHGVACPFEIPKLGGRAALAHVTGAPCYTLYEFDEESGVFSVRADPPEPPLEHAPEPGALVQLDLARASATPNTCARDPPTVVFAHPTQRVRARALIARAPSRFSEGYVAWREFPNRMPDIKFDAALSGKRALVLFTTETYSTIMDQMQLARVLPRQGICSVMLFDLHAEVVRFYFTDALRVRLGHTTSGLAFASPETTAIAFPDDGARQRYARFFKQRGYATVMCLKKRTGEHRSIRIVDEDGGVKEKEVLTPLYSL